jgi:hypothetical protein
MKHVWLVVTLTDTFPSDLNPALQSKSAGNQLLLDKFNQWLCNKATKDKCLKGTTFNEFENMQFSYFETKICLKICTGKKLVVICGISSSSFNLRQSANTNSKMDTTL